ncbi:N,N-dimethylformamidase beta subunit family domain-containing protein [Hydrogenophaga sp.]|uniref:N,N-dimethylformamidase beta subunit family domain-containing protein n=1 Tax=Hydrogenophaga sp. TaxID=1904254 RepID=UPI003F72D89C
MPGSTHPLPPHLAIELPGLHAYAGAVSVAAGSAIGFHVSSSVPYRFSLSRVGPDPDDASLDTVVHADPAWQPEGVQAIHPGSYVWIERGLQGPLPSFTLECWISPWDFGDRQAIVTQLDDASSHQGYGLLIREDGSLEFRCHGPDRAGCLTGPRLAERTWAHIAAVFEAGAMSLWLNGERVALGTGPSLCDPGPAPLRLGAQGMRGVACGFLDADMAMPAVHAAALDAAGVARRANLRAQRSDGPGLLACWPLSEGRGARVTDVSGQGRHGEIVNHATWNIAGPAFDAARVPRFSAGMGEHDPQSEATRHGLRFASDDLVDCRWTETHRVSIPIDVQPGLHVGRFEFELEGREVRYDATFVVRRAPAAEPAPVLVLCATNSWRAYASSPFARNVAGAAHWPRRAAPLPNSHPDAPAYNHYTPHRKGQPTYFAGLRMPWPNAATDAFYAPEGTGFCQGPRLERHLHAWLERNGYAYDLVSDLDLHRDPSLLGRYRCVVINGHSEYWSAPAFEGLDQYLCEGGSAVVLSGNTMYWRVSFDEEGTVMEQRKTLTPPDEQDGALPKHAAPGGPHGEQYHSQDGQRGGLWRFNDRSCSDVIGLETAGWAFADADDFGVYRVHDAQHFLYHQPHETGLGVGDTFGHAPGGALPRAIGHEWDLSIATLRRMTHHVPEGAVLPAPHHGIQVLAQGIRRVPGAMDAYLDFFEGATESLGGLSAEMIYWERPQGGRVFHAGAVGASWVLGVDEVFGLLLRNVLHHFGVQPT